MAERTKADLTSDEWDPWIAQVCDRLGVDASLVDVALVHDLTKQVAHRFARPMAPVSAHIVGIALGLALAQDPNIDVGATLRDLAASVESTLPAQES